MAAFDHQAIQDEYVSTFPVRDLHIDELKNAILYSNDFVEGGAFYNNGQLHENLCQFTKQANLYWAGKQATGNICEVGFGTGHSSLLMLLGTGDKALNFTIFDLVERGYSRPCFTYLESKFKNVSFELVAGDSFTTFTEWVQNNSAKAATYSVVNIDGMQRGHVLESDMRNADILLKSGGLMIVNHTQYGDISGAVDDYVATGKYTDAGVIRTWDPPHRVIQKV